MPSISISLIPATDMKIILPLIQYLNPDTPMKTLEERLEEIVTNNYRCVGVYHEGKCIGVAGLWLLTRFWCGRNLDVDNVVIDPAYRSLGLGEKLMEWIHCYAAEMDCEVCVLD